MQLVQKTYTDPREQDVYPETPESVASAYRDNCEERTELKFPLLPAPRGWVQTPQFDDFERLDQHEAIRRLAARVGGWQRLYTNVRNLAYMDDGLDLDNPRPAALCLADGAPLTHGICTQCGRDNR